MMTLVTLLEGIIPGELFAAIMLILIGSLSLRQGWVAYTEPIPRFVMNYRGWTCCSCQYRHSNSPSPRSWQE